MKKNTGRPSKINKFIPALTEVVNEWMNAIICTDEELFIKTNDKLDEEDRINYKTFVNYKAQSHKWDIREEDKRLYDEFLLVYKKALMKQKENLFATMAKDTKARQKRAWIIERKFEAWNLRKIVESDNKHNHSGSLEIVKIGKPKE